MISQPTTHPLPKSWRVQYTSSIDLEEVHGREPDREILVSKLRPEDDPFDVAAIRGIVESVRKESCPNANQLEMLLEYVRDCIQGKCFFLSWTMFGQKAIPCGNP
ncbi:hypothetical protein ACS0TY_002628 [Phlomoides rotata]